MVLIQYLVIIKKLKKNELYNNWKLLILRYLFLYNTIYSESSAIKVYTTMSSKLPTGVFYKGTCILDQKRNICEGDYKELLTSNIPIHEIKCVFTLEGAKEELVFYLVPGVDKTLRNFYFLDMMTWHMHQGLSFDGEFMIRAYIKDMLRDYVIIDGMFYFGNNAIYNTSPVDLQVAMIVREDRMAVVFREGEPPRTGYS